MNQPAATDPLMEKVWAEIGEHGLERYIAELDVRGYTVIEPEIASPNGLAQQLLDAVAAVAERRNGEAPDLETGATHKNHKGRFAELLPGDGDSPIGDLMQSILLEDQVFEEALMNPVLLTMATYLCGYGVVLSSMGCFMKGPNESNFTLHTDTPMPSPLPPHSLVCNCTYVLTDFNRENGSTAFVPGSHKWCRAPAPNEADPGKNELAVPVEAPAGSLVVWHGNTWHGAYRRTAPGLRVSVPVYMARQYVRTQEGLIDNIPQEVLDRNSARFAILTQQGISYGYESQAHSIEGGERAMKYQ
ncbi:MAG: phytanoyl-CoA dioxygenase family protein, partial [Pseudomonadota bacterium]